MASASNCPTVKAFKTMHKTGEWANYFKEGDPVALEKDFIKVEEELTKGKQSVRKQIEKAKAFVDKFVSDLAIRETATDTSPKVLAAWKALQAAYQAENKAAEKVQDCCDKYPRTSELVRQTKHNMDNKVGFPALFERLVIVSKLDAERKKLQKVADEAKTTRLEAEKEVTSLGATLDPSYVPATKRVPGCY